MALDAVLFDWDGVISDSLAAHEEWLRYCCESLGKPYPYKTLADLRENYIADYVKMYAKIGIMWEPALDQAYRDFRSKQAVPYVEGMDALLTRIYAVRLKVGIVSSNHGNFIEADLERAGIEYCVHSLIDCDRLPRKGKKKMQKPHPHGLLLCLGELGLRAEHSIYIGDTPSDIKAARAVPMKAIAVTWGWTPREALKAAKPYEIVDTPDELRDCIMMMLPSHTAELLRSLQ